MTTTSETIAATALDRLRSANVEVAYAAEFFRWYAEEAVRNIGQISRAPASGARIVVHPKPAGVAVLVTPWIFENLTLFTRKLWTSRRRRDS